eukprot:COSAG02_NODE_8690_length_2478_cov_2.378731_3_plen_92_part_01
MPGHIDLMPPTEPQLRCGQVALREADKAMSSDRHNTMAWSIDDSVLNLRRSTRNILLSNTATDACGERSLAQHLHLHSCNSVHAKVHCMNSV